MKKLLLAAAAAAQLACGNTNDTPLATDEITPETGITALDECDIQGQALAGEILDDSLWPCTRNIKVHNYWCDHPRRPVGDSVYFEAIHPDLNTSRSPDERCLAEVFVGLFCYGPGNLGPDESPQLFTGPYLASVHGDFCFTGGEEKQMACIVMSPDSSPWSPMSGFAPDPQYYTTRCYDQGTPQYDSLVSLRRACIQRPQPPQLKKFDWCY